jgi:hypothetical protein
MALFRENGVRILGNSQARSHDGEAVAGILPLRNTRGAPLHDWQCTSLQTKLCPFMGPGSMADVFLFFYLDLSYLVIGVPRVYAYW